MARPTTGMARREVLRPLHRPGTRCAALLLAFGAALGPAPARAGVLDDALDALLRDAPPGRAIRVLAYLRDSVDVAALAADLEILGAPAAMRHQLVVHALRERAGRSQPALRAHLRARAADGVVRDVQPLWIVNAVAFEALPAEIRAVAARPDVQTVFLDYGVRFGAPTEGRSGVSAASSSAPPPSPPPDADAGAGPITGDVPVGVRAIRAPEAWALGITGRGVLVATIETGVDGTHPALRDRWRGVADPRYAGHPEWAFFDPITGRTFPFDSGSHGTHTTGTLCGGPPGEPIGVAPDAQWIAAAVLNRGGLETMIHNVMLAMQWMIDPDGDPDTDWDVPAVCANPWSLSTALGIPPCDERFWSFIDACEAAGIVMIFSGGAEGPASRTIGRPADRAADDYANFAVGAVDANQSTWPIAGFSSRGPSNCTPDGRDAVKPEVVAPGVNVISSVPGGGYSFFSGTSMAVPHVAGVVALMRQAGPDLAVNEIKRILYDTAVDLGPTGEDNAYGWGMIDAFEAVREALRRFGRGDMNCDGVLNSADIEGFVLALFDPAEYARQYPDCDIRRADMNADGTIDSGDIQGFIDALFGP